MSVTAEQMALKLFPVTEKEKTCALDRQRNGQLRKVWAMQLQDWLNAQIKEHEQTNSRGQGGI